MIVVVAVIAVATGMIVPMVASRVTAGRLADAAAQLLATAKYGRAYAVTRRRECRLVLDRDKGTFGLAIRKTSSDGASGFQPMQGAAVRPGVLPEGVKFAEVKLHGEARSRSTQAIAFNADGGATGAVVRLEGDAGSWTLLVEPWTGRVRLVKGRADELPSDRIDLDA